MSVSEAQKSLESQMSSLMDEMDKHGRSVEVNAYKCCAKVAENARNGEEKARDLETCMKPMMQIERGFQREMSAVQSRVTRCLQDCEADTRDLQKSGGADESAWRNQLDTCAVKCFNSLSDYLPTLRSNLQRVVDDQK